MKKVNIGKILKDEIILKNKLERVSLARTIIQSGFFTSEEITLICRWLGFNDTAFRDKTSEQKLLDYLLDFEYYTNPKYTATIEPEKKPKL